MTDNKSNKPLLIIVFMISFFWGALSLYCVIRLFPTTIIDTITKVEKDVTITDEGIADAVDNVYDSVVVVLSTKNGKSVASGTGFVYDTDAKKAYILTNYHVIEGGNEFYVSFTNGKDESVVYVGGDKYSDIAVLSVDKNKIISVAKMGKSGKLRVGDTVFAVGAPLDEAYSWSVTRGILSGKDRLVEVSLTNSKVSDYIMSVIQTDAAINSGNSGGPLSNSNGEVVGITSMKLVSDGVEGMGFAIPIETALNYANIIRSGKTIERPYLGIGMYNLSQAIYNDNYYNIIISSGLDRGVIVNEVDKGTPAEQSGLKVGDIILSFNGYRIYSVAYFKYVLYNCNVGDQVNATILRDNKKIELTIKLTKSN